MISENHIKTIGTRTKEVYRYKNGIYERAENYLEHQIEKILEEECNAQTCKEIIMKIQRDTQADRKDFEMHKDLLNFNNGVYNLTTKRFKPHDPRYLFFDKINVDYNKIADCPNIKRLLCQLLPKEDTHVILQWFGYCLYRDYFIKKAMIFTGPKNTGKTTVLRIISKLFGDDNISGVSLQRLVSNPFCTSALYHKHINICDDLSANDIKSTGVFKEATGQSKITAEYKFGDQFQFLNYAKLTFACNKIPNVKDNDDDAYFERWIVINFNRQVKKPDTFLLDKIGTDEELSGLLNLLIRNLKQIIKNQKFTYHKKSEDIRDEMIRNASSVAAFIQDGLEEMPNAWISKSQIHYYFLGYCKRYNLPEENIKKFGMELTKNAKYITDLQRDKEKGWGNVKLNDDFKAKINVYLSNDPRGSKLVETRGDDRENTGFGKEFEERLRSLENEVTEDEDGEEVYYYGGGETPPMV
uniref:Putative DNA primase n=1 Tax=viral metagenome TaxID=1070528 RepID=A0A6M3IKT7_9ZZZZ